MRSGSSSMSCPMETPRPRWHELGIPRRAVRLYAPEHCKLSEPTVQRGHWAPSASFQTASSRQGGYMRRSTFSARSRGALAAVLLIGLSGIPMIDASPAGAVCPTLPPTSSWIGGYAVTGSSSSVWTEGDITSTPSGDITGTAWINGDRTGPGLAVLGTITCGQLVGTVNGGIPVRATLSANGEEIVNGLFGGLAVGNNTVGGTFSSARVGRSPTAPASTELTPDPGNNGATPAAPLQVGITSPVAGDLSVKQGQSASPVLGSYQLLDQVLHIS